MILKRTPVPPCNVSVYTRTGIIYTMGQNVDATNKLYGFSNGASSVGLKTICDMCDPAAMYDHIEKFYANGAPDPNGGFQANTTDNRKINIIYEKQYVRIRNPSDTRVYGEIWYCKSRNKIVPSNSTVNYQNAGGGPAGATFSVPIGTPENDIFQSAADSIRGTATVGQFLVPGANLMTASRFTSRWKVMKRIKFQLGPRKSKVLKFSRPRQDHNLENLYTNDTIASTVRSYRVFPDRPCVMLRIWGPLGMSEGVGTARVGAGLVGNIQVGTEPVSLVYSIYNKVCSTVPAVNSRNLLEQVQYAQGSNWPSEPAYFAQQPAGFGNAVEAPKQMEVVSTISGNANPWSTAITQTW